MNEDFFFLQKDIHQSTRVNLFLAEMLLSRKKLLVIINELDDEVLDYTPNERKVESIGTLLLHIAAVEWSWIFEDIDGIEMNFEAWKHAFPLRKEVNIAQIKGKTKSYYLDKLQTIRDEVIARINKFSDKDLDNAVGTIEEKYTIEWILYHIIEHKIQHLGQILLLKRLWLNEKEKIV